MSKKNFIPQLFRLMISILLLTGCQASSTEPVSENQPDDQTAEQQSAPEEEKSPGGLLKGWKLTSENELPVKQAVAQYGTVAEVQSVWMMYDNQDIYFLLQIPGLENILSTNTEPDIFLDFYFDADQNLETGNNQLMAGNTPVQGYDTNVSFSLVVYIDPVSSEPNAQVSKWEAGSNTFSGMLDWGTRFNKDFTTEKEGDYVQMTVPRSILEVIAEDGTVRAAFTILEAAFNDGAVMEKTLKLEKR